MTATLIVPCAAPLRPGEERRPKWMLTTPDGRMLVVRAAGSITNRFCSQFRNVATGTRSSAANAT